MNGRPLSTRKKFQLLILLTLLVWATQTLLRQWGYGAEIPAGPAGPAVAAGAAGSSGPAEPNAPASVDDGAAKSERSEKTERADGPAPAEGDRSVDPVIEKFVPGNRPSGGTLELREEASVYGGEARLKQLCRWTDADAPVFFPVADLVLARLDINTQFKPVGLAEIRATLRDAGVNLALIRFSGATRCTVRRTDARVSEEAMTLEQWIAARRAEPAPEAAAPAVAARAPVGPVPAVPVPAAPARPAAAASANSLQGTSVAIPATASVPAARPAPAVTEAPAVRSLRSLLVGDVAVRLNLPAEQLEINFNPKDENLLNLSEPQFRFNLDARRVRNLGDVEWEVTVVANNSTRKVPVLANARAWQSQVVVNRPLAYRQLIRESDVTERRALVDRVTDDALLAMPQVVGQLAARELKPGMVLTGRMVDPVPLAKPGQIITVTTRQGSIRIKTVARALEGGSFGQTVRVKNDATNEFYDVVLTGPQEGTVGAAGLSAADAKLAAAKN